MCDFFPYFIVSNTNKTQSCTLYRLLVHTCTYNRPNIGVVAGMYLLLLHTCIVHTGVRSDGHQQTDFTILFGWEPWMMALEQFSTGETFGITNHSHRHCRLVASILPSLLHGKNRKIDDINKQNLHLCSVLLPSSLPSSHRATSHDTSNWLINERRRAFLINIWILAFPHWSNVLR